MDAVIKIGGRLANGEHLRVLCDEVAVLGQRHKLLIVPGGGAFADIVRRYDERLNLSDAAAHWMAIMGMDQYGYLLSDLIPASLVVRSVEDAQSAAEEGRVPVLLPFGLARQVDSLPHSWVVTSDSIAAWVGSLVSARLLMLLKDSKAFSSPIAGEDNSSPRGMTLDQLSAWQGVDGYLSTFLAGAQLNLWILNGEHPSRLGELLENGHTQGIRLL